jgi:RNA polymerase sigma-70 factor, ECF subfamily
VARSISADVAGTSPSSPAQWVDLHGDALFRYALVRVRDASIAEDLVQDTLLAGIGAAQEFEQASSERTWLIGIMRHKVMDHFRVLTRERRIWVDGHALEQETASEFDGQGYWCATVGSWQSPERSLEESEFWSIFADCVGQLPEALRAPFALRELDGIDTGELAATFGTTRNNIWVMLSRARQRLRHCLQVRWFAEE